LPYGYKLDLRPPEGYDEKLPPFQNKVPGLRSALTSAADWAAMDATATVLGNIAARAPLSAGLGSGIVAGAATGALAPLAVYGGYETGKKIGELTGLHQYWDEKEHKRLMDTIRKTAGMKKSDYPTTKQLQQRVKYEKENPTGADDDLAWWAAGDMGPQAVYDEMMRRKEERRLKIPPPETLPEQGEEDFESMSDEDVKKKLKEMQAGT